MRHLTYGRLFVYLFLEYGRSRKAMELGSRIDNQLFVISQHICRAKRGRLSQCAKRDRFPQISASLRSERRFVAARVESSFQAKDEQVYSAADWLTR